MSKRSAPRKWMENEAAARARHIRVSPYKLSLVAGMIRGMSASEAMVQLAFSKKRVAREVRQVLSSAISNAENNHSLNIDRLIVADARVGKAMVMKRLHTRARGRSARVLKPFSRLEIVVREKE